MRVLPLVACVLVATSARAEVEAPPPTPKCVPVRIPAAAAKKLKAPRCTKPSAAVQKTVRAAVVAEYHVTK